ncbi:hypothetical protein K491DRAFT_97405 [Lophiostoma macrostomum CBS 122681]|uniref:Uncharacterized protein n=1 Tax=Lophiostoma macrostomum CBS 122681 TaxID=1314788 RepID=A0A6A6SUX0_9PLEO|nr:hypothetical protein K491DRAFT_97405 [Lophiostoma macrostomum CBS 122681]
MRLGQKPWPKSNSETVSSWLPWLSWLSLAGHIRQRHADERGCPMVTSRKRGLLRPSAKRGEQASVASTERDSKERKHGAECVIGGGIADDCDWRRDVQWVSGWRSNLAPMLLLLVPAAALPCALTSILAVSHEVQERGKGTTMCPCACHLARSGSQRRAAVTQARALFLRNGIILVESLALSLWTQVMRTARSRRQRSCSGSSHHWKGAIGLRNAIRSQQWCVKTSRR